MPSQIGTRLLRSARNDSSGYFNSAAAIFSRVNGMSRIRAPSAWATALPIAAAVGPKVHSPMPERRIVRHRDDLRLISGTSENCRIG